VPKKTFQVDSSQEGSRLDVFLAEKINEQTRSQLQKYIERDKVKVSGIPRKSSFILREGDLVELAIDMPEEESPLPENIPLKILYRDEHVVVLDKPTGMVVHPGAGRQKGTLVNALLHHFPGIREIGPEERPGIVHRLDKDTSGVMVIARSEKAFEELNRQFKNRLVDKVYLGLVWGNITRQEGSIQWPLGRHVKHGDRISVKTNKPRSAKTLFEVLRRYQGYTFLEIKPITGRTHQIRVHLAALGHPIVGDTRYGKKKTGCPVSRLFLHAHRIGFFHPESQERMDFVSPLPYELERCLEKIC
jgi:23S rRNA pseudouridine1911/1915/1917 synthase